MKPSEIFNKPSPAYLDAISGRTIKYKKIKISMPHCNVCGERLSGNNSKLLPYWCSCGVWEGEFEGNNYKYFIK